MDRRTRWAVAALGVGTLLSPLNSSMIAVALVPMRDDFDLDAGEVTWVVTVFYLASTVGQPLMGRLGDRFGPRRVFVIGMGVVVLVCAATAAAPTFWLVCAGRVVLALAAATAFPGAVALIRPLSRASGVPASHLLGRIQIANTSGAAIGPVLGGVLETGFGWQALLLVNVPLALAAAMGAGLLVRGDDRSGGGAVKRGAIAGSDLPGIVLFSTALVCWLIFLLAFTSNPTWWLVPVAVAATALFIWREKTTEAPFLDVGSLRRNRSLGIIHLGFMLFNLVFYIAFFGVPQILQERGHFSSSAAGMLMFPLAAITIVLTPLVARAIDRLGLRLVLRVGAALLACGAALLLLGAVSVSTWVVLAMMFGLAVPYCVVNLALTQALYASTDPQAAGVAAGTFQATRYMGAILATTVLGITLSAEGSNWAVAAAVAVAGAGAHMATVWAWRLNQENS